MGTLYRNGIPYVGSGGAGGVEVTQAEYDALPTSEKMNGSIYFITDGSVSYPTASQMRYDNTESGIPSTSVQGAIDELKIEIGDTDISSIGDGTLSGAVSELNNGLIKAVNIPFSSFEWNTTQNRYVLSNYHPTFNTVIGYLVYGTNGMVVFGAYYYAQSDALSVDGWIPSTASKITSSFQFVCYELGY